MKNRIQKYFLVALVVLGSITSFPSPTRASDTGYMSIESVAGPLAEEYSEMIVVNQKVNITGSLLVNNLKFGYGQESRLKYLVCASDAKDTNPKLDNETSNPAYACGEMREVARGNFSNIKGSPGYLALKERNPDGTKLNPEGDFTLNFNASAFQTTDKHLLVAVYGVVDATLIDGTGLKTIAVSDKTDINVIDENEAKVLKSLGKGIAGTPDPDVPGALKDGPFHLWTERILNLAQVRGAFSASVPTHTVHIAYDTGSIATSVGDVTNAVCNCTIDSVRWRFGGDDDNASPLVYAGAPREIFDDQRIIDVNVDRMLTQENTRTLRVLINITLADGTKIQYTDTKNVINTGVYTTTDSKGTDQGGLLGEKTLLGVLAQAFSFILYLLISILNSLMTITVIPLIRSLLAIQAHDPAFSSAILGSWIVVRNITNIFFILAMIAMSIGTLFDLHGYNYKELLGRLVLMALLVNFSLVIARVVLGVADTLQAQFIPFGDANVMNNLLSHLAISPLKNLAMDTTASDDLSQFTGHLTGAVAYLVFALASFAAFMALAIFLLIRICGLLVLLVTSPIAYAGMVFGDHSPLGKLGAKWWSNFIRYSFFTPIIAFFLYLAAYVANSQSDFLNKSTLVAFPTSNLPNFSQTVYNIASNVIVIGLIFAGLKLAKGFDIQAVNTTVDKFSGAFSTGGKTIRDFTSERATGLAMRAKNNITGNLLDIDKDQMGTKTSKLRRGLATVLAPKQRLQAGKENFEKKNKQAKELAAAAISRSYTYSKSHGLEDNDAVKKAKNKVEDERSAYYDKKDKLSEMKKLDEAFARGEINKMVYDQRSADIVRSAFKNGDLKRLVEERYGEDNMENRIKYLGSKLAGNPQAKRILSSMNEYGREQKKVAYIGMDKVDFSKIDDAEELNRIILKVQEEQQKAVEKFSEEDMKKADWRGTLTYKTKVVVDPSTNKKIIVPDQTVGPGGTSELTLIGGAKAMVEILQEEGGNVEINKHVMDAIGPDGIDVNTGRFVFNSEEKAQQWNTIVHEHPEVALRIANRAIGAKKDGTNGFTGVDAFEKETVIREVTRDQNTGRVKSTSYHAMDANGAAILGPANTPKPTDIYASMDTAAPKLKNNPATASKMMQP